MSVSVHYPDGWIGIPDFGAGEVFETRLRPVPEGADPDLAARAQAIHDRLLVRAGRAGERRLAAG